MDMITAFINLLRDLLVLFGKKKTESEVSSPKKETSEEATPTGVVKLPKFRAEDLSVFIRKSK